MALLARLYVEESADLLPTTEARIELPPCPPPTITHAPCRLTRMALPRINVYSTYFPCRDLASQHGNHLMTQPEDASS
jgi:hypothetical protein